MENLETIIAVCGASVALCIMVVFGGGIVYLIHLKNRSLRKAAQAWHSTTGRVLETRVVPRVYFWGGITEAEAEAQVKKWKEEEKFKPKDLLAGVLMMFGPVGEFAGELVSPARGGGSNLDEWPMVVYEYEVDGSNTSATACAWKIPADPPQAAAGIRSAYSHATRKARQ